MRNIISSATLRRAGPASLFFCLLLMAMAMTIDSVQAVRLAIDEPLMVISTEPTHLTVEHWEYLVEPDLGPLDVTVQTGSSNADDARIFVRLHFKTTATKFSDLAKTSVGILREVSKLYIHGTGDIHSLDDISEKLVDILAEQGEYIAPYYTDYYEMLKLESGEYFLPGLLNNLEFQSPLEEVDVEVIMVDSKDNFLTRSVVSLPVSSGDIDRTYAE